MLIARILGKDRRWKGKIVLKHEGLFKRKSFEYEINPECVYLKKIAGLKLVAVIDYIEGCRRPLQYTSVDVRLVPNEIPIDEIAMTISRALKNIIILLTCIFSCLSFVTLIIVALKIFGALEGNNA